MKLPDGMSMNEFINLVSQLSLEDKEQLRRMLDAGTFDETDNAMRSLLQKLTELGLIRGSQDGIQAAMERLADIAKIVQSYYANQQQDDENIQQ